MNAITEWSALPATEMFLRDNRDDSDFSAFMSIWFFEEQKHSLVLMEYLKRFRPDLVPTEAELHEVRFEFEPAPALETLMLHFCGEIRLNHWYRRAAEWHTEPVIKHIYTTLAQDEARHGGAYLRYMKRAINKFGDEAKAAFAKVGVLMASARRTAQALHPTNLHVNKSLFPRDTIQSPPARPRVAGALAGQADQVRRRVGEQGGRAHPAQPEPADGPQLQERAGAQPLPQGSGGDAGPERQPGRPGAQRGVTAPASSARSSRAPRPRSASPPCRSRWSSPTACSTSCTAAMSPTWRRRARWAPAWWWRSTPTPRPGGSARGRTGR